MSDLGEMKPESRGCWPAAPLCVCECSARFFQTISGRTEIGSRGWGRGKAAYAAVGATPKSKCRRCGVTSLACVAVECARQWQGGDVGPRHWDPETMTRVT